MARNDSDYEGFMMNKMVLFGGCQVGFNTNPETEKRPCFIEVDGQKIVCLAQGGECRYNYNYYSPGLNDKKSWTTPIIDESCRDECLYKVLVCDDHDEKCEGSITYYPHYNKFNGQFKRYCRNFDKFVKGSGDENGDRKIEKKWKREDNRRDIKRGIVTKKEKGKNGNRVT